MRQILYFLKGVSRHGLFYSNYGHSNIECFSDTDWIGSKVDRWSTTRYCVFVGRNLVSWRNKKQNVVSHVTAESKYRAIIQVVSEII